MTGAAARIAASLPQSIDVEGWFRRAQPGEKLTYFSGAFLPKSNPAVREARRLIDQGLVLPFQVRTGPGQFDYCLTRRANADAPASRGRVRPAQAAVVQDEAEQLLAVLRRLANMGKPCPPNAKLAELACLKDADAVRYRMNQLEKDARIRITLPADSIRVVTIVASGKKTARSAN